MYLTRNKSKFIKHYYKEMERLKEMEKYYYNDSMLYMTEIDKYTSMQLMLDYQKENTKNVKNMQDKVHTKYAEVIFLRFKKFKRRQKSMKQIFN